MEAFGKVGGTASYPAWPKLKQGVLALGLTESVAGGQNQIFPKIGKTILPRDKIFYQTIELAYAWRSKR